MSNSINKPGLEYLRNASDRLAADSIKKLRDDVAKAILDFGCSSPEEGSSDWFHAEGKAILMQLAATDPTSDWPFWVWDRSTNKVLQETESNLLSKNEPNPITEFSAMSFNKVATSVTLGNVPSERTFTVHGSVGTSLGGEHLQVLKVQANDEDPIPDFSNFEIEEIRKAIRAKAEEEARDGGE